MPLRNCLGLQIFTVFSLFSTVFALVFTVFSLFFQRAPLFSVSLEAGARGLGRGLVKLPRWTGGGPLIGAAYAWVVDLMCYCVTEYYFYTAGS